ncbi:MAG: hypothetical protein AAB652_01525 [Patescibacteria group bacterium]
MELPKTLERAILEHLRIHINLFHAGDAMGNHEIFLGSAVVDVGWRGGSAAIVISLVFGLWVLLFAIWCFAHYIYGLDADDVSTDVDDPQRNQ